MIKNSEPSFDGTLLISKATITCRVAKHAYIQARKACQQAEAAELSASGPDEMETLWNREREAFSAADAAAKAAIQIGKALAKYSDHPSFGTNALKAAIQAFEIALAWIG